MGLPANRSVIVLPFPFSDLSNSKLRPAVVLATAGRGDFVLCQITSNSYADPLAIPLFSEDFESGSLRHTSFARPGKLFTANISLVAGHVGVLTTASHAKLIEAVVGLLRGGIAPTRP